MMQFVRLIMVIILFMTTLVYAYIYMKSSVYYWNFWAVFMTFLAELFLLVGSGKQKVYQDLTEPNGQYALTIDKEKKPKFKDEPEREQWMWFTGVFFYSMAFPFVIVSNIWYFSSFSFL